MTNYHQPTFLYAVRNRFYNPGNESEDRRWASYVEWSRLNHVTELITADTGLNENLVEIDQDNRDDWNHVVFDGSYQTGFYTTADFVLSRIGDHKHFNLLAAVISPDRDCALIYLENYDFIGYDLLDQYYDTSALTNCSGFDNTFSPAALNNFGLISDYEKALDIHQRLWENNAGEEHADTNIIAIWRHRIPGHQMAAK
ncbi:hypothetical protein [Chitinophaga sp. YR627]|uniref:hypothetical protein n=1 Tax=Chitinophaga sp. YR627 TaxID=1881041 RepID=UPI000B7EA09A|nr:hypothetical protein [Chitinophaga sp. YR627]